MALGFNVQSRGQTSSNRERYVIGIQAFPNRTSSGGYLVAWG